MITIVNYGLGNLGSIVNMLKKIGLQSSIANDPKELEKADKIILPGVGAFDTGMRNLKDKGWMDILDAKVFGEKVPTLGICLGMQLMTKGSEEGKLPGLGWVDAETKKFNFQDNQLKIPHMGWNLFNVRKDSHLIKDDGSEKRFYFVHSYFVSASKPEDVLLECNYDSLFCAAFERNNLMGVQFHPEKSHRYGMELLRNFGTKY